MEWRKTVQSKMELLEKEKVTTTLTPTLTLTLTPLMYTQKETLAAKNSKLKQGGGGGSVSSDERAAMEVTIQP